MVTLKSVKRVVAQKGMKVHQHDVKSAFLYGELAEKVYVEQPQGYEREGSEQKVYHKHVISTTLKLIEEFKVLMKAGFEMTDMGEMEYFLGVEVIQDEHGIYLSQRKYAREILKRFNMGNCNSMKNPIVPGCKLVKDDGSGFVDATLYKQMVGCMMYLSATRPDLMFVISLLSRYMANPTEQHMAAMKRVLRYIKGILELGIFYKRGGSKSLVAYSDSDYACDLDSRRSTSGYVCFLSDVAIAWLSKRQPIVTLSTTEAEFVVATSCVCQVIWMRWVFECISSPLNTGTTIYCDNMSTIKLSKNPIMHNRSKHIDARYYFLRDLVNEGTIELSYCNTLVQAADIMTKPLKLEVCLAKVTVTGTGDGAVDGDGDGDYEKRLFL
ncbi:putative RNA-directed DNA polymerase [Tanacetum coccineum]